jgi:hypothetical protein
MAAKLSLANSKWMAFIMPSFAKPLRLGLLLWLVLLPAMSYADPSTTEIRHAELIDHHDGYQIETEIDYQLSATAKEALDKGIPLAWDVYLEIRRPGFLWGPTLYKDKLRYTLQYHALLKQYAVKDPRGNSEMFLTLTAALNFMSIPRPVRVIDYQLLESGKRYQLAVRSKFNREQLPVPLRPFAYLDSQWFLSSSWFLWPIQK